MSKTQLGPGSHSLLLQLLEAPHPILSGEAIQACAASAERLIAAGLLKAAGYEPVTTSLADHDDAPVTLARSDNGQSFGYFSAHAGWIDVPTRTLARYRLDIPATLEVVKADLNLQHRGRAESLVGDALWDLGAVRLGRRAQRNSLWFGRRLSQPQECRRVREMAGARPCEGFRIILTSTRRGRWPPEGIGGAVMVWLPDVLEAAGGLRVDPRVLAARLDMGPAPTSSPFPVQLVGDGRIVHFQGRVFRFNKGDTQRRIIMALHKRLLQGERRVPSAQVIEDLKLPAKARIRDYFKSPVHQGLIVDRNGLCGFDVGDD